MRPPSDDVASPEALPEDEPTALEEEEADETQDGSLPLSPYSRNRTLLRNYTLPTLDPSFHIPASPPTSPPPGPAKQFAQFLKLKEKDVHFNQKLAGTMALRNPNILENLIRHVGVGTEGQYVTNYKKDVWSTDPAVLSKGLEGQRRRGETVVQTLGRLQKEGFERAQKERKAVEFVGSTSGSGVNTPTAEGKATGQVPMSAAERIMSGLDRDRKGSPNIGKRDSAGPGAGGRRRDDERDRRRDDDRRDRERDRDRDRDRDRGGGERHKRPRSRSRERSRDRQRVRERDYGRR